MAVRVQVYQKNLPSYSIYFSFSWLFNVNQFDFLHVRDFLWSNGKGTKRTHAVDGIGAPKAKTRGLGLKDFRQQGIALAVKWIVKSVQDNEPWKVLIRHKDTLMELNFEVIWIHWTS